MAPTLDAVVALLGLALLVWGGQRAVEGAVSLARAADVSAFFVGVTLVATGSSLPELAATTYAAAYGAGDIAVGHVVGSATSQVTLGLGLVGFVSPLVASREHVRVYGGGMVLAMVAFLAAIWSGTVTRLEGALLALTYVGFVAARYEAETFRGELDRRFDGAPDGTLRALAWTLGGLLLVVVGGHLLVTRARALAGTALPTYAVGLLTGLGTTAPEIALSVLAVREDADAIAVGTLLGSNITDPLFSFGVAALVGRVTVTDPAAAFATAGYMIAASAVVVSSFYWRGRVGRPLGVVCCGLYLGSFLGV